MTLPEVELRPDDTLDGAVEKVAREFIAAGTRLDELEPFPPDSEPASRCRLFQGRWRDRECIVVVAIGEWSEGLLIAVLNVLLHIRTDPDPPGAALLFRFFSAQEVPAVLRALFGDSRASELECRAALVAKFGNEIGPSSSLQHGAVAIHLLRECLGVATSFFDPEGDLRVGEVVRTELSADRFHQGAAPINALVVLGFLYGEMLRVRVPSTSRWAQVKSMGPWPVLVFGPEPESAARSVPQVVFNPINTLLNLHQGGTIRDLRLAWEALREACQEKLGRGAARPLAT